jgi:ribonucleoside-diphosphate reductase alpha chain
MFKPEGFSLDIFKSRYAFTEEETWEQFSRRIAQQMAKAESPEKQKIYEEKFFGIISKNEFVPGGRICYNSGRVNAQLLNCFVLGNDLDSKEGWGNIAKEMIVTSMTGGGCGIDFSDVRPRGAKIGDQKGECPGPVALMKLVNGCAEPVRAGGQRRVALMFSLDLHHPDIEEFLDAKLTKGELTYANVSVRCHDVTGFKKRVETDGEWELSWKGQYKKTIKARDLWQKIVKNAWSSAEPGFLNWELANNESNIYYIEPLVTTNPCGEIAMSSYDSCDLGHLVLTRFVENNEINYSKLADSIRTAVRFLDNVLTVNTYPLTEMQKKSHQLRRIGLGTTGLADMLTLIGVKYGSEDGNKVIDKLFRFISKVAYETSIMLAIEKGPFPVCDRKRHIESGFIKRMPKKIRSLILEHGIRNCAILTQAPTGTVSIVSGNCSSGVEPMFAPAYERRFFVGNQRQVETVFHPLFDQFMKEGKSVEHFVGSTELSVEQHLEVQRIVQKHIDNAVSKTINMAKDYSMEDMSKVWLKYLPDLKGTTFYRDGSRNYIDENGVEHEPPLKAISLEEAKKRFAIDNKVDTMVVDDCAKGICEVSFSKKD